MVTQRLERLGEEERLLLETASVAGTEFDGSTLAGLVGMPLLTALRWLQRLYRDRALVEPLERGYRFAHALYRDAIYADLAPDLRRALHKAWATELEALSGQQWVDPEVLGSHWEQADCMDRARALLREASRTAVRRGELARAWELARRSGALESDASNEQLREDLRTLLSLMPTYATTSETERVESLYDRIRIAAEELGDLEMMGRVTIAAAWNDFVRAGAGAVDQDAVIHAVEGLPHGVARGNGAWLLGYVAELRGDLAGARRYLKEAHSSFAAEHDPQHERHILSALGFVLLAEGKVTEARRSFTQAADAVAPGTAPVHEAVCRAMAIASAAKDGDVAGTGDALEEPIRMLERGGQTLRAAVAMTEQAICYLAEGEVRKARAALDRAEPVLRDGTMLGARAACLLERARLDIAGGGIVAGQGELELAEAGIAELPEPRPFEHHLARAFLATVTGTWVAAQASVAQALDEVAGRGRTSDVTTVAAETALLGVLGLELGTLPARIAALAETLPRPAPCLDLAQAVLLATGERAGSSVERGVAAARDTRIGVRQAEFQVAADLLEATALAQGDHRERAKPLLEAAYAGARRLDHPWFELAAIRLARRAGLPYDEARVVALRRLLAERNPDRTSDTAAWLAFWLPDEA